MGWATMRKETLPDPAKITRVEQIELTDPSLVKNFVPVEIQDISPHDILPFSLYFPFSAAPNTVTFSQIAVAGSFLHARWKTLFRENNINYVYVHTSEFDHYITYLNKRLTKAIHNPYLTYDQKNELLYRNASYVMNRILEDPRSGKNIQMGIDFIEIFSKYITTNDITASMISKLFSKDYRLFSHSIQVTFLTATFCRFLKKSTSFIVLCGNGALFHDVGKVDIPYEILMKNGRLSPEEMALMEKHPSLGLAILSQTGKIEQEILDIVYQHHEAADGSGYPEGITLEEIVPMAQIVHIIDCYDAMTTNRSYRLATSPFETLKTMCLEMRASFNTKLLEQFIQFLGY